MLLPKRDAAIEIRILPALMAGLHPAGVPAPPGQSGQSQEEEQARQEDAATLAAALAAALAGVGQVVDVTGASNCFLPIDFSAALVAAVLGRRDGRAAVATDVSGGHGGTQPRFG